MPRTKESPLSSLEAWNNRPARIRIEFHIRPEGGTRMEIGKDWIHTAPPTGGKYATSIDTGDAAIDEVLHQWLFGFMMVVNATVDEGIPFDAPHKRVIEAAWKSIKSWVKQMQADAKRQSKGK